MAGAAVKARAHFEAGRLDDAIEVLGAELRSDPTDVRRRTFLFELLCFAGQYDRAEKQLEVVAGASPEAGLGAWLYRSALHAERTRQEMFDAGATPGDGDAPASPVEGSLNGNAFGTLVDADERVGPRLELFAAGQYTWIPLEHIQSIHMEPPTQLRDLLWAPARVQTAPTFQGLELGEVLIPVLAPGSWRSDDDEVRLGRVTDWHELTDGRPVPIGQKLLLVDDEPFPILELRTLEISPASRTVG
jgi:type VI secretion system protein ImpE